MSQSSEMSDQMLKAVWGGVWNAVVGLAPTWIPIVCLILILKWLLPKGRRRR